MVKTRIGASLLAVALVVAAWTTLRSAEAKSGADINRDVDVALTRLYASVPEAKALGAKAAGILVFPSVVKAGFLFGAQYGDGALRQRGRTTGYYNTVAASYGLQAGVQEFGYALFFMSDSALAYLSRTDGFEIGVGPSIVLVDEGMARTITSTTMQHDIYAFVFEQRGLMAGMGLQGSKITRIER